MENETVLHIDQNAKVPSTLHTYETDDTWVWEISGVIHEHNGTLCDRVFCDVVGVRKKIKNYCGV